MSDDLTFMGTTVLPKVKVAIKIYSSLYLACFSVNLGAVGWVGFPVNYLFTLHFLSSVTYLSSLFFW